MPDNERAVLVHLIATELDKPSIYMGGPSKASLRKAEAVVRICETAAPGSTEPSNPAQ